MIAALPKLDDANPDMGDCVLVYGDDALARHRTCFRNADGLHCEYVEGKCIHCGKGEGAL